jgi:hypothetical protein
VCGVTAEGATLRRLPQFRSIVDREAVTTVSAASLRSDLRVDRVILARRSGPGVACAGVAASPSWSGHVQVA